MTLGTTEEVKSVILAAGKGTRMKSSKPKVLHEIFSKALVGWVVEAVQGICNNVQNIVIVGHQAQEVENYLQNYKNTKCILQDKQLGTGHAVSMAYNELKDFKGKVLIVCGDTPLITSETLNDFINYHNQHGASLTVMTTILDNPQGYGRIVRSPSGGVKAIVEQKDASDEQKQITEVNAGIYCLNWQEIMPAFKTLKSNNSQGEYYLTDIVGWAQEQKNKKVLAYVLDNSDEIFGINSKFHLAQATKIMQERKLNALMEEGVTIVDPITTSISPDTHNGADTIILPKTDISGKNKIGSNCKIGPFSHFRGGCEIGDFVKVGNFVELKNAKIDSYTNVSHLSYVGDAKIGSNVNIGAGTITANYNSLTKFKNKTVINDGASIGSNTVLVAPVELGQNAFIAAGSVITKNVEENALAIARGSQKEFKNWVKKSTETVKK